MYYYNRFNKDFASWRKSSWNELDSSYGGGLVGWAPRAPGGPFFWPKTGGARRFSAKTKGFVKDLNQTDDLGGPVFSDPDCNTALYNSKRIVS